MLDTVVPIYCTIYFIVQILYYCKKSFTIYWQYIFSQPWSYIEHLIKIRRSRKVTLLWEYLKNELPCTKALLAFSTYLTNKSLVDLNMSRTLISPAVALLRRHWTYIQKAPYASVLNAPISLLFAKRQ